MKKFYIGLILDRITEKDYDYKLLGALTEKQVLAVKKSGKIKLLMSFDSIEEYEAGFEIIKKMTFKIQ